MNVASDGAAPGKDAILGFESFIGAIHFFSEELDPADIAPVVRALREGHGWVGSALDIVAIDLDSQHGLFWEAAQATGISAGRLKLDLLPDVGDLLRGSSFEMPLGSMGWPNGSMGWPSRMAGVEALVIIPGQRFSAVTPA